MTPFMSRKYYYELEVTSSRWPPGFLQGPQCTISFHLELTNLPSTSTTPPSALVTVTGTCLLTIFPPDFSGETSFSDFAVGDTCAVHRAYVTRFCSHFLALPAPQYPFLAHPPLPKL